MEKTVKLNAITQILWRSILSGLLYEISYQAALALRWKTIEETCSFIIAAVIGVIIAFIIRQHSILREFIAVLGGLLSAFIFNAISVHLNIPWKILVYFQPEMAAIGHATINEGLTVSFVTLGYLLVSFCTFFITLIILSVVFYLSDNTRHSGPSEESF